jgi:pimeloyl-ACP methyl ester carboxylesterase
MRFILFASTLAALALQAAPPPMPAHWTDGYVMANDIRIHYYRTGGSKPVMIMAHGYSDDGRCWTNFAKELEANYDIIMVDARGHGRTDPPQAGGTMEAMVEDLAGVIRQLGLQKPIVMGHSMGSAAAAWFASRYPDIPKAVVLEDPGVLPRPMQSSPAETEKRRAQILQMNNMSHDEIVAVCMKGTPKWGESECGYWAPSKRLHHPNAATAISGARPKMTDLLAKITAPTLILKADAADDIRKQNEDAVKDLKLVKLVHIKGAGHNVRRDEKQATLDTLRAFLATVK